MIEEKETPSQKITKENKTLEKIDLINEENKTLEKIDLIDCEKVVEAQSPCSENPSLLEKPTPISIEKPISLRPNTVEPNLLKAQTSEPNKPTLIKPTDLTSKRPIFETIGPKGKGKKKENDPIKEFIKAQEYPKLGQPRPKSIPTSKIQTIAYKEALTESPATDPAEVRVKKYFDKYYNLIKTLFEKPCSPNYLETQTGYFTTVYNGLPKVTALFECPKDLIRDCYDFGLLNAIYTMNGEELTLINSDAFNFTEKILDFRHLTKADKTKASFINFYATAPETTETEILTPIQFMKIGTSPKLNIKDCKVKMPENLSEKYVKTCMINDKAYMLKVIKDEISKILNEKYGGWIMFNRNQKLIISSTNKTKREDSTQFYDWKFTLSSPDTEERAPALKKKFLTKESRRAFCKINGKDIDHCCKLCEETLPEGV